MRALFVVRSSFVVYAVRSSGSKKVVLCSLFLA